MTATSVGLLERAQQGSQSEPWDRLVELYSPLIYSWLHRYSLSYHDAEDLAQEVLAVVVRELRRFHHNGMPGAFRNWLRTITTHRLQAFLRSRRHKFPAKGGSEFANMVEQLQDPGSHISQVWNDEFERHVSERLLRSVEHEFQPTTWNAFWRVVKDGNSAANVAAELGISVNAVLIAKSRVLRRLREVAQGLLD